MKLIPYRLKPVLLLIGIVSIGAIVYYLAFAASGVNQNAALPNTVMAEAVEKVNLGQQLEMEFVRIHPGTFSMGSSQEFGDEDEGPMHEVKITKAFFIGKYEVTQEQWEMVMGSNPSAFKSAKLPVESVSWEDCQRFVAEFQKLTGRSFALPTEAQWEFASRAGTTSPWSFGNKEELIEDFAWINTNSGDRTHPVGEKKPNPWGLHDMLGNVQEWVSDWYSNPYERGMASDPQGPSSGDARVIRGGAWGDYPANTRSSYRNCMGPEVKHEGVGLRLVLLDK